MQLGMMRHHSFHGTVERRKSKGKRKQRNRKIGWRLAASRGGFMGQLVSDVNICKIVAICFAISPLVWLWSFNHENQSLK